MQSHQPSLPPAAPKQLPKWDRPPLEAPPCRGAGAVWNHTKQLQEARPSLEAIWPRLACHMPLPDLSWGKGGQALGTSTHGSGAAPSPRGPRLAGPALERLPGHTVPMGAELPEASGVPQQPKQGHLSLSREARGGVGNGIEGEGDGGGR